jgi:hypothetical protein
MRPRRNLGFGSIALAIVFLGVPSALFSADDEGWINLIGDKPFDAWKVPTGLWQVAGNATLEPKNPRRLAPVQGAGILINGPIGRTTNLITKASFGAIEAHVEFMVPKDSNSGVKFEGVYEIQIADSWGVQNPTASHCGGIYPRAEMLPIYHHIDNGYPPRANASKPPGEWQTLDVTFEPPKFDAKGKKTASARFVKVVLNGQLIHEDVEVPTPTGNVWRDPETPTGPLLLQADHGPVAFRNVRVRPRPAK